MSVRQINTSDYDYSMFLETLNKSYKGKSDITISAYDTTAAPDVKVGSVWEDNGAIFILETADMTPTGYAGITNSTTFYLYYDESASVFIYSNTAPTFNDALQDWYNGNDRAFFSMYKDSGGTLYQNKGKLVYNRDTSLKTYTANGGDTDTILPFINIGQSLTAIIFRGSVTAPRSINLPAGGTYDYSLIAVKLGATAYSVGSGSGVAGGTTMSNSSISTSTDPGHVICMVYRVS